MGTERVFPGAKEFAGWKFFYIEATSVKHFLKLFDEIGTYIERKEEPFPDVGFGTANSCLTLPDGRPLYGLSVKGDIAAFELHLRAIAAERGLTVVEVKGPKVILPNGDELALDSCGRSFFDF